MVCLSCENCDADVEFTFDVEETLTGFSSIRRDYVVDAIIRHCGCIWTDEQLKQIEMEAIRAANENYDD